MLKLIERQASRHDYLPSSLGDMNTYIESVRWGNKYLYWADYVEQTWQVKNLLYCHTSHDEPAERTLFMVSE
jgi:hypothetical protein